MSVKPGSWFSKAIADPIKDVHILRVFALDWTSRNIPPYISIQNKELFKDPTRWINLEGKNRRVLEKHETERLRERWPSRVGRTRTVRTANQFYHDFVAQRKQGEWQDARWTVQCIVKERRDSPFSEDGLFDELLYRLYANNLDVFGDKAARDLYVFDIGPSSKTYLAYAVPKPSSADVANVRTGCVRVRLYAIMKELASPPIDDFDCTFFSPIIVLAAVVSPIYNKPEAIQEVLDLSLDLEAARFRGKFGSGVPKGLLDDLIVVGAEAGLRNLKSKDIDWSRLTCSPLTQFTAVIIGLVDAETRQLFFRKPALFLGVAAGLLSWRTRLLHYIARMCVVGYRITRDQRGLWASGPQPLSHEREFSTLSFRRFVREHLPRRSAWSVTSDVLSVVSPGRWVVVRSLSVAQAQEVERRREEPDFTIDYDYNRRDVLDSVALNILLLSLVTSQEALLSWFHELISESGDIAKVKAELKEFDNFYDVDLFDLPNGANHQDSFNELKHALNLDHEYEMLHKKLEITVGNIHADDLRWAIVAFLFLAFIQLIGATLLGWLIVVLFSLLAIGSVIIRPFWSQLKLLPKKVASRVIYAPEIINERLREWLGERGERLGDSRRAP